MSLNRIPFLEEWEHNPAGQQSDEESYQDLPESSLSSSFQSTYSRHLTFNPYAGPGWNETDETRPSFLSRETTQESRMSEPADTVLSEAMPGTTGAFEVSPARRIVQVCLAVVYCFLAAGIVFGFAALKPILIREKVYRNLCSRTELEKDVAVCDEQEIRLNLMFTIAAVATNVSALPVGTILDAYGPRVSSIIGSLFLTIGAIFLVFARKLPFDGYIPGYLFLSLGGPFVFISSFHLSNTFPKRAGLILSMLTGAFDASSALFLIFRLLNEHTHGAASIPTFFLAYLAVPLFILVAQMLIMPATSYKTSGELVHEAEIQVIKEIQDGVDESIPNQREAERQRNNRRLRRQSIVSQIHDLLDDGTASVASALGIDESVFHATDPDTQSDILSTQPIKSPPAQTTTSNSGVWGALHGYTALQQILTPWFILITLFTMIMMLRINYFITTLRQQYTYLLSSRRLARQINITFDILLPIGGILSVPVTGLLLDNLRTQTTLLILVAMATLIGVLGCIPRLSSAYLNIIFFVTYRPFYYTSISDYAAKVFGFQTFGKVYGLIICLAGVFNFAQAGLDALTLKMFDGNPVPVNVGLTIVVGCVGVMLVGFVAWKTEVMDLDRRRERAEILDLNQNQNQNQNHHGDGDGDGERRPLLRSVGTERRHESSYGV